jgi:replicative DNA helicase
MPELDVLDAERVEPNDVAAEQAILGAMLWGSDDALASVVESGLTGEDYYRYPHMLIHDVCMDMYGRGEHIDTVTVAGALQTRGVLGKVGGAPYLHTLTASMPAAVSVPAWARSVLDKKARRDIIAAASRATQRCYSGMDDAAKIADTAQGDLARAMLGKTGQEYAALGDLIQPALDEAEAIAAHDGSMRGIPTGFADLDGILNGLQPGQLIVIGARPAIGKSTFALDIARHAALRVGAPTAFFSLEMGAIELTSRLLAAEARVRLDRIRSGGLTGDDWNALARVVSAAGDAPLFIDETPGNTVQSIRAKCRRIQQAHGLRLVVVDYLQLMEGRRSESRQNDVAEMSRALKLMAKELGVPVIALSQLNRNPEQRADKRPQLGDLRESGAVEQDADVVILLHREDAYDPESARSGEGDLIVAKHRNGPTGTVAVAFLGHQSRFADMAGEF